MKKLFALPVLLLGLSGCFGSQPDANTQAQMATTDKKTALGRSMDMGRDVGTDSYISQINQNVPRDENGKPPATLEDLKRSLKDFPAEMWIDKATGKPLRYDPITGMVSR